MGEVRGMLVITLVCSALVVVSAGDAPAAKCPSSSNVSTTALKKKLFCNYDSSSVPVNGTTGLLTVDHRLLLDFFIFNEYYDRLDTYGEAMMDWKDERLVWNKSEYNGLAELEVHKKDIWVPDLALRTPASVYTTSSYQSNTICDVTYRGFVSCSIPLVYIAHCNPDIRRWPFDSHTCVMKVSTRMSQIDFRYVRMGGKVVYQTDRYWRLVNTGYNKTFTIVDNIKQPTLVYTFSFERHSSFLVATLLVPSIVMLTATLCVFCLDPAGIARLFLIGGNIICHCLFLMYLSWYLPANGDKTPIILTFFRDSFVVVGVSLLVTVSAATMAAAPCAPPGWLSAIAETVRDSPARCLLFDSLYAQSDTLNDGEPDNVEVVMTSSASNKWRLIATLLDRVSLLVFAVILAVLASAFLP